ncbi:MAG TPA: class F sortase [Ktedonobacteraceae bacterium]|nr:class F sortase [Ktedonobacteraceae bacterium]
MRALKIALSLSIIMLAILLSGCGMSITAQEDHLDARTQSTTHLSATSTSTRLLQPQANTAANPERLVIPSIGVNAPVEMVGILNNGDLATPTHDPWNDVGWFVSGPQPGQQGSAAMDGHLDRPGGYPAVFWNLRYMHVGERIMVMSASGKTLNFQATRVAFYAPQAAPIQEIFGNSGGTYLNLITCAGDWIPSQHQTTLRLVVYTTLV